MNRKQGIMMILLGLCAGLFGSFIMMQLTQKATKAEQFILVDRKGKIHAILGLTNLGTASLGLWDTEGKNRVVLGFLSDDELGIGLNDEKGNRRVKLKLSSEGIPSLLFLDENGNQIWSTPNMDTK